MERLGEAECHLGETRCRGKDVALRGCQSYGESRTRTRKRREGEGWKPNGIESTKESRRQSRTLWDMSSLKAFQRAPRVHPRGASSKFQDLEVVCQLCGTIRALRPLRVAGAGTGSPPRMPPLTPACWTDSTSNPFSSLQQSSAATGSAGELSVVRGSLCFVVYIVYMVVDWLASLPP